MAIKVKLNFILVGKSISWKRNMTREKQIEFRNSATLSFVRDTVINQFGNRALVIINESVLESNTIIYPKFYSAGWFISEGDDSRELVVIDHGNTMEAANKAVIESVKVIDWQSCSRKI